MQVQLTHGEASSWAIAGAPQDNMYEVALWADMLRGRGDELFYAYMVDNQAIVMPETIDAIRALTARSRTPAGR